MKEAILVIDTGSSSMRGVLYDDSGQVAAEHQIGYHMHVIGEMATQPIEDFTAALLAICCSITAQSGDYHIKAVALTSQRSSVLPVQADGKPLDDVMMWYDKRSAGICEEINRLHGAHLQSICGSQATPVLSAPKICWYKRERPAIYQQAHRFMGIHDYLLLRLTGRFVTDVTFAGRTNLLDIAKGCWSPTAIDFYGLEPDKLCTLVPVGSVVGEISPAFAAQTGLPTSAQVISCGGDQQASAIGAGLQDSSRIAVTAGSGGYAVRLVDSLQEAQSQPITRSVAAHPGRWMAEASCMAVGTAYNRIRKLAMGDAASVQALDGALLQTAAGAHGLVMATAFDGKELTAEQWQACCREARAEDGDCIRAAFEAMAAAVADCCSLLRGVGSPPQSISVAGGLSNFALFNQTLADMLDTPVWRLGIKETTCMGAWAQAAVALGVYPSLQDAMGERAKPTLPFKPNVLHHEIYARQNHLRRKLYEQMDRSGKEILLAREDEML